MAPRTASGMSFKRFQILSNLKVQQRRHSGPLYKITKSDDPSAPYTQSPASIEAKRHKGPAQESYEGPNAHRQFYKSFGFPVLKVALGSLLTYQVIYWSWLKLESLEEESGRAESETSLKSQLVEAVKEKAATK